MYAYSERFILPLSHDEVVHGKKSLLDKMPGSYEEKFSQLKLLAGYMTAHPGKKLMFMGGELGMFSEWKDKEQLDWNLLGYDAHRKLNEFFKDLLKLYKRSKPLYELDDYPEGFEWIDTQDRENSVLVFARKGKAIENHVVVVLNLTPVPRQAYRLGVLSEGDWVEIFNTDHEEFYGSGIKNNKPLTAEKEQWHGKSYSVKVDLPPLSALVLKKKNSKNG